MEMYNASDNRNGESHLVFSYEFLLIKLCLNDF